MFTNVSSMPIDEAYNETSGSGNEYENYTLSTSQMINCQCNDTDMIVGRNFLLKWLNNTEHSIGTLSKAAHKLKVATDYLQVNETL